MISHNGVLYKCLAENGYKFTNIRVPLVSGWLEAACTEWQPVNYTLWDLVVYNGNFYTLISEEGFDNNINPYESDNWGAVADYDAGYNDYKLSGHEYVVYCGKVFYPETDVNADIPETGKNLSLHDPRNSPHSKAITTLIKIRG